MYAVCFSDVPDPEGGATTITLAELCEIPHLGLTPLAGEAGLDRRVVWTHVCELEDPTPFLEGGELVMSVGLQFPRSAKAQVGYIERLSEGQMAGFALTVEVCPRLTAAALRLAGELAFPILSVGEEVSFIEVERTVANANDQASQRRLITHIRIFDLLQSHVNESWTTTHLLGRIGELTGYELYAEALDGDELLGGVPRPPRQIAETLPAEVDRLVTVGEAHALPISLRGANLGRLIAVERKGKWAAGLVSLQHAATILTVELERAAREARLVDGYRSLALAEILAAESSPGDVAERLRFEGFDLGSELVLVALVGADGGPLEDRALERISDHLRRRGVPNLSARRDGVFLLIEEGDLDEERLFPAAEELRAGAGRPSKPQRGLGMARREALTAAETAVRTRKRLVTSGGSAVDVPILPADRPSLESLVDSILGPIVAYDAEHQSDLVASLRSYLEADRSLSAAAAQLFVHPNTLGYRLRRIEDLSGRPLASVETQTNFWLALKARALLAPSEETGEA